MHRAVAVGAGVVLVVVAFGVGALLLSSTDSDRNRVEAFGAGRAGSESAGSPDDTEEPVNTATTTPPPRTFTIASTGDLLIHTRVYEQALVNGGGAAYEFSPMLEPIEPIIEGADLAICHLETPLSADNSYIAGFPVFSTPLELARDAAEAGYDTCSTASNHALDQGFAGVEATLDHLDAAGLAHAGTARSAEEDGAPNILDANGVAVAHLSYSYDFNGIPIPAEQPWSVNPIDEQQILADAAAAKAGGAEFVVVSLQWGNEYQREPSAEQQALAPALLASPDIDLIVGSHVHVVQPIQKIDDEYVVYGQGNLLSNQSPEAGLLAATQDGMVVELQVTEEAPGRFRVSDVGYTPTFVERPTYRVTPVEPATNQASYDRTVEAVTLLGPEAFDGHVNP